ncbi:uncharacterized protein LOC117315017 [Pecten maximus]|uniref:uncharacterized protein LOC117315017 n=1 Tax=Pecten maximus TaxID=6579 RepID=UPI0014580E90|nr:uncharacterized protein LOC117315017 [Pecten maximus]
MKTFPTGLKAKGEMVIRCHLLAVTLDLPARAMVMNMKQFNGKFGCCYCEDEGVNPANRPMLRYYPYTATSVPRLNEGMINDARKAATTGEPVKGIKGACPVVVLKYVDLPKTFVIDWMHSVLLGVVKTLLSMWCDASYKKESFYVGDKMALVNSRLQRIQVPDYIVRQQRNIDDHKHWKGNYCY